MKNYVFDGEEEKPGEETQGEETETEEESFLEGFEDEEEKTEECAECGAAVNAEKKVVREIENEEYVFCSKECAEEFEDSLAEEN